jgi:hypothetical protein
MTNLHRRIERLERPVGAGTQAGLRLIMMRAGATLDVDQCVAILAESGFLVTGSCISLLNFLGVPHGLSAQELERYLREHGAEICNRKDRTAQ